MRLPLDTTTIGGYNFKDRTDQKSGLPDTSGVKRHIGLDYRAPVGTIVRAPGNGTVTGSYTAPGGNQVIEIRIGGHLWRFLHLSQRLVANGQTVEEGQEIARSGNTGGVAAHLHVDTRKDGTSWNAGLANYVDPREVVKAANAQNAVSLPPVGSRIHLNNPDTRTTFKAGTAEKADTINVTDGTFDYVVRGPDPKFRNRVLINSASAGGDGVSLALYYLDGRLIPGWSVIGGQPTTNKILVRLKGDKNQHWNMRTSPEVIPNNIRKDGHGIGGQTYVAEILPSGWARIVFLSKTAYIGPKAYERT